MPLNPMEADVVSHPENFNPTFPMQERQKVVPIQITTAALDKLGANGNYIEACEEFRGLLESIASTKYDTLGAPSGLTITADDNP